MMNMMNELGSFLTDPTLVMCVASVATALLLIAAMGIGSMRSEWMRVSNLLGNKVVELTYVEKKLKEATAHVLYNNYPQFDEPVPLGLAAGHFLRGLAGPCFSNILNFATAVAQDEDAARKLSVVLETDRGTFIRTLDCDYTDTEVYVKDESMSVSVKWCTIEVGVACNVYQGYIVFQNTILRYTQMENVALVTGDQLKLSYTLNPDDLG